jgi:hypothetical protein
MCRFYKFKENAVNKNSLSENAAEREQYEFTQSAEGQALLALALRSRPDQEGFQHAHSPQLYLHFDSAIELNTREEPKLKISSPLKPLTKERSRLEVGKKKEASEFKPQPMKRV